MQAFKRFKAHLSARMRFPWCHRLGLTAILLVSFAPRPGVATPVHEPGRPEELAGKLQVERVVRGDLDGDGRADAALVLAEPAASPTGRAIAHRHLLVALQTPKQRYRLVARSRVALLRADEGGAFGDPLEDIDIRNRVLIVSHYGGSNWRWAHTDRFAWLHGRLRYIGRTDLYLFTGDASQITRDTNLSTGDVIVRRQAGAATPHTDTQRFHEVQAVPLKSAPTGGAGGDWDAPVTRLRQGALRLQLQACTVGDTLCVRATGGSRAVPILRRMGSGALKPVRTWQQGNRWQAAYRLNEVSFVRDDVLDAMPQLALQCGAVRFSLCLRRKATPGPLTLADCVRSQPPD